MNLQIRNFKDEIIANVYNVNRIEIPSPGQNIYINNKQKRVASVQQHFNKPRNIPGFDIEDSTEHDITFVVNLE